jgi:hypothetical protein
MAAIKVKQIRIKACSRRATTRPMAPMPTIPTSAVAPSGTAQFGMPAGKPAAADESIAGFGLGATGRIAYREFELSGKSISLLTDGKGRRKI